MIRASSDVCTACRAGIMILFLSLCRALAVFGLRKQPCGLRIDIRGVPVGPRQARDFDRVAGLRQIQRHARFRRRPFHRHTIGLDQIRASFEQLVPGLQRLDAAIRVVPETLANDVLQNDHVAGLRDGEVRLGRHDQRKRLQFGGHLQAAIIALHLQFTEVCRASLRRNRPHDVCEVLGPEPRRRVKVVELRVYLDVPLLAADVGVSFCFRQQRGAFKVERRVVVPRPVIDRRRRMRDERHAIKQDRVFGRRRGAAALGWVPLGPAPRRTSERKPVELRYMRDAWVVPPRPTSRNSFATAQRVMRVFESGRRGWTRQDAFTDNATNYSELERRPPSRFGFLAFPLPPLDDSPLLATGDS
jgi:hypothetical protein